MPVLKGISKKIKPMVSSSLFHQIWKVKTCVFLWFYTVFAISGKAGKNKASRKNIVKPKESISFHLPNLVKK